ncbi:hypothetical protein I2486_21620, partial [Cellulophaga sp. E16_2]|uniref:hypothetical protein n=1 Tax=Cellulophaga sp. E16_2 TaxID=2789297 RepID=UPI001A92F696
AIIGFTQTTTTDYTIIDTEITDHYKDYKYSNKKRPGYYLQINNQNCHYDIKVNDLNGEIFFDPYPMYSNQIPLNLNILKSGKQKLSVKIFPLNGDLISEKAGMQLRLIRYEDMTDIENEFGKSKVIWEWEMPKINNQKLPFFLFETFFEAKVPYGIETLDLFALDLSELDEKLILQEVIKEFQIKQKSIVNKTQDLDYLKRHIRRPLIQIYPNEDIMKETIEGMVNLESGMKAQPIEDFEICFYYNNKIVTLLRKEDKESALWFENPDTGDRFIQPYYIFKHKETGTWHMW